MLDDVLRRAYARFSGAQGFRSDELRALASEVAGSDLGPWLHGVLATTEELDYREALDWYGLHFTESKKKDEDDDPEHPGWLGADLEAQGGRLLVTHVKNGTPASEAGLNVGDEIVAVGDYRVPATADAWKERLKSYPPGTQDTLLVARRERHARLVPILGRQARHALGVDIGRVGEDQVVALAGQRLEQVAAMKRDPVAQPMRRHTS